MINAFNAEIICPSAIRARSTQVQETGKHFILRNRMPVYIGDFKELAHGAKTGASLFEIRRETGDNDEKEIADYLRAGEIVAISPCLVRDVFDEKGIIGSLEERTDGQYIWPSDLVYYYESIMLNCL